MPDARQLLQQLADGIPSVWLTRAAKAAFQCLAVRQARHFSWPTGRLALNRLTRQQGLYLLLRRGLFLSYRSEYRIDRDQLASRSRARSGPQAEEIRVIFRSRYLIT